MNEQIISMPIDDNELEYIENSRKNSEGYPDPTPYKAIKRIDEKTAAYYRFKNLLKTIWYICDQAGFKVEGRIALKDKKTGRVWR